MPQFRESGVCNEVTLGGLSSDAYFVMATAVGVLDDVVPQPVFFDWLLDPSSPLEYTTNVGIGIADGSITEAMLTTDVQNKLNAGGGGGSSRKDGFDSLGNVTGQVTIDFTGGTYDNKTLNATGPVTLMAPTVSSVGAYDLMINSNGNAVTWNGFNLSVAPTLSASG